MKHTHGGYGFFPGGDPRRFSPDEEGQLPEEKAAHEAACKRWNDAEKAGLAQPPPEDGSCVHSTVVDDKGNVIGGSIITLRRFGLGGYEWDCDDPDCEPEPPEPKWDELVDADRRDAAVRDALAGDDEDLSDQDDEEMPF